MKQLSLHYCIRQLTSQPLGWVVKLTPIRQLSSSLVLNLYQANVTDIIYCKLLYADMIASYFMARTVLSIA
jgi:hypothetical protein